VDLDATELVGYAASALVVVSLAMTSVVRLRLISLAGSIAFVAYGTLIGSIPIVVTNASIACINIWFLSGELGGRRDLGAVVVPVDSPFLLDFLRHHAGDIANFQPEYDRRDEHDVALVLTRDGLPAGVVLGRRDGDNLEITLDYVLRAYRDSRLGRWLYGRGATVFHSIGVDRLTTVAGNPTHRSYLLRVGFAPEPGGHRFVLAL
jgi:hypothetical protein